MLFLTTGKRVHQVYFISELDLIFNLCYLTVAIPGMRVLSFLKAFYNYASRILRIMKFHIFGACAMNITQDGMVLS